MVHDGQEVWVYYRQQSGTASYWYLQGRRRQWYMMDKKCGYTIGSSQEQLPTGTYKAGEDNGT